MKNRNFKTQTEHKGFLDYSVECDVKNRDAESAIPKSQIKMRLGYFDNGWAKIIKYATLEMPAEKEATEMLNNADFTANYGDIMRGNRTDWLLVTFKVQAGKVRLTYYHPETGTYGHIAIVQCPKLRLVFEVLPEPYDDIQSYWVNIEHHYRRLYSTTIEEHHLGSVREIKYWPTDSCHPDKGHVTITDY